MNAAMARAAAVLLAIALLPRVYAGVSILNAVSSCPSITKAVAVEDEDAVLQDTIIPPDSSIVKAAADRDAVSPDASTRPDMSIINAGVKDTISLDASTIGAVAEDTISSGGLAIGAAAHEAIPPDSSISDIVIGDTAQPVGVASHSRLKFGRRAAFNYTQAAGMRVRLYSYDGESFYYTEYRNKAGFGVGFEVAGIIRLSLSEALALNFSPGVVFRKPVNTAVVGASEVGVSFPVSVEWGPFGGVAPKAVRGAAEPDAFVKSGVGGFDWRHLRLFGGVWVGVPVYAWIKWNGERSAAFKERAPADFGLAAGFGVYVSDRAFIDARGILGVSEYDGVKGHRLHQLAVGVNYVR